MAATINPKLENVFVNEVVIESIDRDNDWRVYCVNVASGRRPIFLYLSGTGRVVLGRTDVYYDKLVNPHSETLIPWDDEQAAFDFSSKHFQLKRAYCALKEYAKKNNGVEWTDFVNHLNGYLFYRVAPPVSKETLLTLERGELDRQVDLHVGGNFDLDPRIKAWGYGGLVRFPSHGRYVAMTKYRGHALIIKPPKAGCSHIAHRTMPTYDQISVKSFEGFADAEGNVSYSPLHENYHACVLDELDQLDDGVMRKLFTFLESGEYLAVKATKRINNRGNSRVSFITNPKSMDEKRGMVFAVNSMLDAFSDVLFKLTAGNFVAGMSRFGLVYVSSGIAQARGKSLPPKEQEYADAVATSLFEVIAPDVAKIYEDEQTQAWLSQEIGYYSEAIDQLTNDFDDTRLKQAWGSQKVAYRHVRGAALEIAIAEHAYEILHGKATVAEIVDDATAILEDVVDWNLLSLREIINVSKREEDVNAVAARMKRAKPAYVAPIIAGLLVSPTGAEVDVEAHYDALPREIRIALDPNEFYCWSHISRRIRKEGAFKRLVHALANFGVAIATTQDNNLLFNLPAEKRDGLLNALQVAYGVDILSLKKGGLLVVGGGVSATPNTPTNPTTSESAKGSAGVAKQPDQPEKGGSGVVFHNYGILPPAILGDKRVDGVAGVVNTSPPMPSDGSRRRDISGCEGSRGSTSQAPIEPTIKKVVFKPKEAGGGYDLV